MTNLMQASYEFMSRPDDERFLDLKELHDHCERQREISVSKVVSSRKINFAPTSDNRGIVIEGKENVANPTYWSFNQLSTLSGVPSSLLRAQCEAGLAPLAADNLNAGMKVIREAEEVGMLIRKEQVPTVEIGSGWKEEITLAAATGPRYGRIWNADVTKALVKNFGSGTPSESDWTVPGYFGKPLVEITKADTTLFAGDRDMFVFLADEKNRIVLPNRRNGQQGSLARGFFVWNSEVGSKTLGLAFFLFDYVCCNRIVWGVEEFQRIAIRHTVTAPDRWVEEIRPTLLAYTNASALPVEARLRSAQEAKIDKADEFLANRFGRSGKLIMNAFESEEHRPIETVWDAVTAVTAFAKTIAHTDERVELERMGGSLLDLKSVPENRKSLAKLEDLATVF